MFHPEIVEDDRALLARLLRLLPDGTSLHEPAPPPGPIDLLLAGDFAGFSETVLQVAARTQEAAERGRRVALLHLGGEPGADAQPLDPRLAALVRAGVAVLFDARRHAVAARCIEIHDPSTSIPALERARPAISGRRWIVHDRGDPSVAGQATTLHLLLRRLYGREPRWTSCCPATWQALAERVPVTKRPVHPPAVTVARSGHAPRRPVLGTVLFDAETARRTISRFAAEGMLDRWRLRLLVPQPEDIGAIDARGVEVLDIPGAELGRFLAGLDAALWPEDAAERHISPTFLASASRTGIPLYIPRGLSRPYLSRARPAWRLAAGSPRPLRAPSIRRRAVQSPPSRRVLFVTANGVGLGHLTRLAAIARWLPRELEPVFVTMSQAVGLLHRLGLFAELLTTYAGHPHELWNRWLAPRIDELLEYHRPAVVVLDSSNPYAGVLEACVARADVRLVWVRRGMWRPEQNNARFLARAPLFDLVLEPGELAAERDRGATATSCDGVIVVDPVSLLEEGDLLSGEEARRQLGLDPDVVAVLVQLGSGTTRDAPQLTEVVLASLERVGGAQAVIAGWMIADDDFDVWPHVRRLEGFPIGRYFPAFDFTVSAAGYNSFHDILRFGLPAIFVPNEADFMDDQASRAAFAQDAGAAFDLRVSDFDCLDVCIRALMDPACRELLRANARALWRPDSAHAAAHYITALVLGQEIDLQAPSTDGPAGCNVREAADAWPHRPRARTAGTADPSPAAPARRDRF